jgi:hypothetical protein
MAITWAAMQPHDEDEEFDPAEGEVTVDGPAVLPAHVAKFLELKSALLGQ